MRQFFVLLHGELKRRQLVMPDSNVSLLRATSPKGFFDVETKLTYSEYVVVIT